MNDEKIVSGNNSQVSSVEEYKKTIKKEEKEPRKVIKEDGKTPVCGMYSPSIKVTNTKK